MKFFDLVDYYRTNFTLINDLKWSVTELENMLFWEREVYVKMLHAQMEEKRQERESRLHNKGLI